MTDPLPASDVHQLPPPKARPPHVFGDAVTIAPEVSDTGFEQKEKTCKTCGAMRVTVLGSALSGRGWRLRPGAPLVETDIAPPCGTPFAGPL